MHAEGDVGDSVERRRRLCAKAENVQESQRKGEEAGGASSRDHHVIHYIGTYREAGKIGGRLNLVVVRSVVRFGLGGPGVDLRYSGQQSDASGKAMVVAVMGHESASCPRHCSKAPMTRVG